MSLVTRFARALGSAGGRTACVFRTPGRCAARGAFGPAARGAFEPVAPGAFVPAARGAFGPAATDFAAALRRVCPGRRLFAPRLPALPAADAGRPTQGAT